MAVNAKARVRNLLQRAEPLAAWQGKFNPQNKIIRITRDDHETIVAYFTLQDAKRDLPLTLHNSKVQWRGFTLEPMP